MATLEHPTMPGQKIIVADISVPEYVARGWVHLEDEPELTAADIEAAEAAAKAAAVEEPEPQPEPVAPPALVDVELPEKEG